MTILDFRQWLKEFMDIEKNPVRLVRVRDLDGLEYYADADMMIPISPSREAEAMADPNLRHMLVTVIPDEIQKADQKTEA